jgi:hypothetical protein
MRENKELDFSAEELKILRQDFGRVSDAVFDALKKEEKYGDANIITLEDKLKIYKPHSFAKYEKEKIVWFGKLEGHEMWSNPIGTPKDYISIRDDFDALKTFLGNMFTKGIAEHNFCRDMPDLTNTSDYAMWLYRYTDNKTFKQNFEKAVIEIATNELNKEFEEPTKLYEKSFGISAPQYNCLFESLRTVMFLGKPDNSFRDLFDILKEKAIENNYKDSKTVKYGTYDLNKPYFILAALSSIQKGRELGDFWINTLEKTNDMQTIYVANDAILGQYISKEDKLKQLPKIIKAMENKNKSRYSGSFSFHLAYTLSDLLELEDKYKDEQFNKKPFSFDLIEDIIITPEEYTYKITRITTEDIQRTQIKYDLKKNKTDNPDFEKSIKNILKYKYPIFNKLGLNSIKGRKIKNNETHIIDSEQDLSGYYEGVMQLSHNGVAFLYNREKSDLKIYYNMDYDQTIDRAWEDRDYKFEKLNRKIPDAKFESLNSFGKKINRKMKKMACTYSSSISPFEGITEAVKPNLIAIIENKLIKRRSGIVK